MQCPSTAARGCGKNCPGARSATPASPDCMQARRARLRKISPEAMSRFAANLSFLFNEVPFLDRFAAAANAGFNAVEFAFAYEHPARELTSRLASNGLEQVLVNAPPGDLNAGDRGLAGCPGREHEFAVSFATALRYAQALSCPRIHVMAGVIPASADEAQRAQHRSTVLGNLRFAARQAGQGGGH